MLDPSNGDGDDGDDGVDDKFKYMVVGTGCIVAIAAIVIAVAFLWDTCIVDEVEPASEKKHKSGKHQQSDQKKKPLKKKKKKDRVSESQVEKGKKKKKGKLGSVGPLRKKQRQVVKMSG